MGDWKAFIVDSEKAYKILKEKNISLETVAEEIKCSLDFTQEILDGKVYLGPSLNIKLQPFLGNTWKDWQMECDFKGITEIIE